MHRPRIAAYRPAHRRRVWLRVIPSGLVFRLHAVPRPGERRWVYHEAMRLEMQGLISAHFATLSAGIRPAD